ncbi:conserved hypothetical protein [Ricinus communis]|uniref:Uncharacterized protein n=1 Tax=Ricinus communis TaxID=3988 RepID=B9T4Q1_RICCO|nr:conserved hypothetical protein [Ricinus communis]
MFNIAEGLRRLSSQTEKTSIEEGTTAEKKRKDKASESENLFSSIDEERQENKIKIEQLKLTEEMVEEKGAKSAKVFETTKKGKKA